MNKRLASTAYHEAGHVAAYLLLGKHFDHVTIEPGEDYFGYVLGVDALPENIQYGEQTPRRRRMIEERTVILSAGNVAERCFLKKDVCAGSGNDWAQTLKLLELISESLEEASAYHAWITARTRNLLLTPLHWPIVETVALALLEHRTLTYAQVKSVVRQDTAENLRQFDEAKILRVREELADYRKRYPLKLSQWQWTIG